MGKWLRELEDGTDTILWLLMTEESLKSGEFYFDRKIVTHYLSKKYNPSKDERTELLKIMSTQFLNINHISKFFQPFLYIS